jgi:hypothetical protein
VSDKEAAELEELLALFKLGLGATEQFAAALQVRHAKVVGSSPAWRRIFKSTEKKVMEHVQPNNWYACVGSIAGQREYETGRGRGQCGFAGHTPDSCCFHCSPGLVLLLLSGMFSHLVID